MRAVAGSGMSAGDFQRNNRRSVSSIILLLKQGEGKKNKVQNIS